MLNHHPLNPADAPQTGLERLGAALSQGSILLGAPFVMPILVLVLFPFVHKSSSYVRDQAIQALLFHVLVVVVGGALWGAAIVFWHIFLIGWPFALVITLLAGAFSLWAWVIALVATIQALRGNPYRLPVVGRA
jgi:uncharacterized membrane protein